MESWLGKPGCSFILMSGLLWCLVLPRCSFMCLNSLLLQTLLQSEYEYSRGDGAELQTIRSSSVDVVCRYAGSRKQGVALASVNTVLPSCLWIVSRLKSAYGHEYLFESRQQNRNSFPLQNILVGPWGRTVLRPFSTCDLFVSGSGQVRC